MFQGDVIKFLSPNEAAWARMSLHELLTAARQAFEQQNKKDALALARAILNTDADNQEAMTIHAWVQRSLEEELDEARQLFASARPQNDSELYRRAEIALRRILHVDFRNEIAAALLRESVLRQQTEIPSQRPAPAQDIPPDAETAQTQAPSIPPSSGSDDTAPAVTAARRLRVPVLIGVAALAVAAVVFGFLQTRTQTGPETQNVVSEQPVSPPILTPPPVPPTPSLPEPLASVSADGDRGSLAVPARTAAAASTSASPDAGNSIRTPVSAPADPNVASRASSLPTPTPDRPQRTEAKVIPAVAPGTLAVNALIPVDLYLGDKYLGSTPLELQLPPGFRTLEYRYGNLRKTVSLLVKSNETITTTATFEVVVQINARPWAQVFIEGAERTALGQTPLGEAHVSLGSTLVFRNPGFPEKKYRVTGESAIQVVFP